MNLAERGIEWAARWHGWREWRIGDRPGWRYPVGSCGTRWRAADGLAPKYLWLRGDIKSYPYYMTRSLKNWLDSPPEDARFTQGVPVREKMDWLILACGEIDFLTSYAAGLVRVISFFGEMNVPDRFVGDLETWGTKTVRYWPDTDEQGSRAAEKLNTLLSAAGISFDCRQLPDGVKDINDLWMKMKFDPTVFVRALHDCHAVKLSERTPIVRHQSASCSVLNKGGWQDWRNDILVALEKVSPQPKGLHKHRRCPNPRHADHHPSFRITERMVPICSCGVISWVDLASWVGVESWELRKKGMRK